MIAKFAAISGHDEGKKDLVDAGILPLLDRPDAADAVATCMDRRELGMLKMTLTSSKFLNETRESMKVSNDGTGRPSDATRQQMTSAMTESMEGMMGMFVSKMKGDSSESSKPNHFVGDSLGGEANSKLVVVFYEDPSKRFWPCANPKCGACEQFGGARFRRCPCKRVRYCSQECQVGDSCWSRTVLCLLDQFVK